MKLDLRRELHTLQLCHKNIYFFDEASLSGYFNRIGENRERRTRWSNQMNMDIPNIRSGIGRMYFMYRGPRFWHDLDNELKSTENYTSFRRLMLKKLLPSFDDHPT